MWDDVFCMATSSSSAQARFDAYVERLGDVLGHADRRAPLRAYPTGLLLDGERKSVEPMAARIDLVAERARLSPPPRALASLRAAELPEDFRPRGAAAAGRAP